MTTITIPVSNSENFTPSGLMHRYAKEEKKMLEARKRTAVDGRTWWCVFDTSTMKWSTSLRFGKYKTKRECQFAICER